MEEEPKQNSMAAFSPKRDELKEALSILYIRNNASGRNKFKENWPDVAPYVFGEQLMKYDHDGWDDPGHCRELEEMADQKRLLLKDTIEEMVDKSVDSGTLQFEYVGRVIDNFGPLLSTFLYAEDVIERVRPNLLRSAKSTAEHGDSDDVAAIDASATASSLSSDPVKAEAALSQREAEILSNKPADDLDDIKPIETPEPQDQGYSKPSASDLGGIEPAAGMSDQQSPESDQSPEVPLDPAIAEAMKIRAEAIGSASFESGVPPLAEETQGEDVAKEAKPEEVQTMEQAPVEVGPEAEKTVEDVATAAPQERTVLATPVLDDLDDVKPIDMQSPLSAPTAAAAPVEKVESSQAKDLGDVATPKEGDKTKPSVFGAAPKPMVDAEPEKAAGFKKGLVVSLFNTASKAA